MITFPFQLYMENICILYQLSWKIVRIFRFQLHQNTSKGSKIENVKLTKNSIKLRPLSPFFGKIYFAFWDFLKVTIPSSKFKISTPSIIHTALYKIDKKKIHAYFSCFRVINTSLKCHNSLHGNTRLPTPPNGNFHWFDIFNF